MHTAEGIQEIRRADGVSLAVWITELDPLWLGRATLPPPVSGYVRSEDWKVFYVVYMTDAYFTQDQIMAEFSHTNTDKNWKPILVYGKGSRK